MATLRLNDRRADALKPRTSACDILAPSDGPQPTLKLDYSMGQADHLDVDAGLDETSQLNLLDRVNDDSTMGDWDVAVPERG